MDRIFVVCGICALFIFVFVYSLIKRSAFRKHGIRMKATVKDIGKWNKHDSSYTVEYAAKGKFLTAKCAALKGREIGDTIEIVYLPENPEKIMTVEKAERNWELIFGIIMIIFSTIVGLSAL